MFDPMADPLGPGNFSTSAVIHRQMLIKRFPGNEAARAYFEGADEAELVWLWRRLKDVRR